ncbi:unnamed protein product [Rotaria sp. Silwood2]|nr:unnamed protein product [Rotaria sp. Silwood2]
MSDHPRHVFRNVVQTALMRAARYSSKFEVFNHELHRIRLLLLYNSYPLSYINEQFRRFFLDFMSSSSALLPLIDNENRYFVLRQKLLAQPTAKQTQVDQSAARGESC